MIISHLHKFIFIHIHKCAGTSISRALLPFLGKDDILLGCTPEAELLNKRSYKSGGLNKHSNLIEIKQSLDSSIWNSYFKFTFVRNPWDLLVSKYHWALKTKWDNEKGFINKIKKLDDFEEYVLSPLCNKRNCKDIISSEKGEIEVDFIGKYENLERDFLSVCKKLSLSTSKLNKFNPSLHNHYTNYYNPLTRDLVSDWFEKDINEFNYSFDQPGDNEILLNN